MKNRLIVLRAERKISQQKLSEVSGINRVTISEIETEKRDPDIKTVVKLVKALNVPASEIFFDLGVV